MNKQKDIDNLLEFIKENNQTNEIKLKKKKKIVIILINLLTIMLLVGGGFGIKTVLDQKKDMENIKTLQKEILKKAPTSKETNEMLEPIIDEEKAYDEYELAFKELIDVNSETVGWLKINNTRIDLPVVQTTDNKYYLNHDFNKNYNSMGWVYADYRNSFPELSQNTIIYGHTYKDTIMLSSLQYVLKDVWLNNKDNYLIEFNTLDGAKKWHVFSIYTIEKTSDYLETNFSFDEFKTFINKIKERSIKDFNVDINSTDRILTISTCYIDDDHRLVVHAKLMDE